MPKERAAECIGNVAYCKLLYKPRCKVPVLRLIMISYLEVLSRWAQCCMLLGLQLHVAFILSPKI